MQNQKGISTSVGIIVIIVAIVIIFGGVFAYQYFSPKTQPVVQTQQTQNIGNKTPIIEGISVEKPNLVVKGQNLSKVQIYFVPTGTGIDPETMSRIENAVKQSETDGNQVWTYRYPSDLLITNIFAKGFDDKGNLVKEVDLPITGASALTDALYGNATDQTVGEYAKQFSATTYEANIKFSVPVKSADLNSSNIKFCVQDASAVAGANPNNKCEVDNSWNFNFSYNSTNQILNIKTTNITANDKSRDYGPFNIGCAACTEGLNLTNIHDVNGNLLPNLTIYVHKDYNK